MTIISRRQFAVGSSMLGIGIFARGAAAAPSRNVSWLDEIQRAPQAMPADAPTLAPLLVDKAGNRISDLNGWNERRQQLRTQWLDFLGSLGLDAKFSPQLTILREENLGTVIRQRVAYEIEPGLQTEAFILRPAKVSQAM